MAPSAITRLLCLAFAGTLALAALASPSFATPTGGKAASSPAIESKKQAHAAALKELARTQEELQDRVDAYVQLGREADKARAEISEVTTQIAELDEDLVNKEDALVERAVEIYRTDRIGMVGILLGARSSSDLFNRLGYLMTISRRDALLITEVRLARSESLWLQEGLTDRLRMLSELQYEAAKQRSSIESDLASQKKRAEALGRDLNKLIAEEKARMVLAGTVPAGEFDPDAVISDAEYANAFSMDAAGIQAFLNSQPGVLKAYIGPDHAGVVKPASQMIAEAAQAWGVSPRVILVSLQKEQSLLERGHPTDSALDWAMGCGKMDGRTLQQYRGFGNQIWFGARALKRNTGGWSAGVEMHIDGAVVLPANRSTYSLYKYTPHFPGVMAFWRLYWRYFGNPMAALQIPA